MNADNAYDTHGSEAADRSWLVLLHLSLFLGYIVPLAGFVAPIAIWLLMKDNTPEMDEHGRNVADWIVTSVIAYIVSVLLCLIVIGIPLLILMGVLSVVFPIIGAVKASQGVAWRYPGSLRFF